MTGPYDLVTTLGVTTDAWTAQATGDAIGTLSRPVRDRVRCTQGSPSNYSKSGNTHAGRGAVDIVITNGTDREYLALVKALRRTGFAAWERPAGWDSAGGIRHIHAVLIGHPKLDPTAAAQTRAYARKTNGLRNDAPDPLRYHPNVRHRWRPPTILCRVDLANTRRPELRAVGRSRPDHNSPAHRRAGRTTLVRHAQVVRCRRLPGGWSVTVRGAHLPTRIVPAK